MADIQLVLDPTSQLVTVNDPSPTVSVRWDQAVQKAVINTAPGPTIASRAYGILHTAMFDAWAAYDLGAVATQLADDLQRPLSENTEVNKIEAMSFAAYRVLVELFPTQRGIFDQLMVELGLDPNNTTVNTSTAAGIGNVSAEALMQKRRQDGANQLNGYVDNTGYQPVNAGSNNITDLEKWTPEFVPIDSTGNQQQFLTPQWAVVDPFALDSPGALRPVAPEPFLLVDGATVDLDAGTITLADNSVVVITPAIVGTIINPDFITQTERVVAASANLTDEQKLIAEFWEDGGGTSFPPGTWLTFGEFVSARDDNTLDEDAELFFALGNAVFDAGVATWEAKRFYDYVRPVRAIRELGALGLLNNGTIGTDAITNETGFVIEAWSPGAGTQTILAENFLTYQTPGQDPSPPFAEYTSGHSSFSAAGAEILRRFTGNDSFGGSVTFQSGESRFENTVTPALATTLAWDTFTAAADEAGLSRIYGGIHFDDGDINGRALGRAVGNEVWDQVQTFANGATTVNLEFSLAQLSASLEIGVFVADDAIGTIDGLAPGDPGYTEAALARCAVLFSPIPDNADFSVSFSSVSTRSFISGSYLSFFSISGGTIDSFLRGGGGSVSFSSIRQVETTTVDFSLEIEGLNVSATQVNTVPIGIGYQGVSQAEIIDLTSLSAAVDVNFTIQREASLKSVVGFYAIDDISGQIKDTSGNAISAGVTTEYIQAALNSRIADISLSVENNSSTTITSTLEAGQIIAPFIVVNGTIEELLDGDAGNDPAIYFPFIGANADGADHVRLLGNNVFGFEDLPGGGDLDFDDFVVEVSFG
ncbi:DUF4114 domain-containing protein [Leptolyngbya cf. ectocarpi LEGE 11479]|uniref:DUF4114 domain-containing protein n=1 Tax=Leptolyngbya cf. ectocarpi LEGE 11479 TaxID=1828722 RepID=A0A928X337_LEPEC|nr:DUF4114 domain-containing protein [Leptolyngbya ectocarpi]MBE9066980.1 DUF4114 domain-containing protein [Leptolyngbya cf. ectocarpi LEGE 11479]